MRKEWLICFLALMMISSVSAELTQEEISLTPQPTTGVGVAKEVASAWHSTRMISLVEGAENLNNVLFVKDIIRVNMGNLVVYGKLDRPELPRELALSSLKFGSTFGIRIPAWRTEFYTNWDPLIPSSFTAGIKKGSIELYSKYDSQQNSPYIGVNFDILKFFSKG